MSKRDLNFTTHRRGFLGTIAATAAALGIGSLAAPFKAAAESSLSPGNDADAWFNKIRGKHRIMYDTPRPNGVFPFAWARVFLMTNAATGSSEKDCGVVVILRHEAIGYAFHDNLWDKYKFGELFKADDPATSKPSMRNPFWKPKAGDFKVPGIGNVAIGINELQESGVMFGVCDVAMTVYSNVAAGGMKMSAADVKKDWMNGLLPGIQVLPSGVWGVGRAQEHGCHYCYAG